MLVVLIGGGKMHKIILPQVPSGNYVINDNNENLDKRLIEIEAQDGKWQVVSDYNARILNNKYVTVKEDQIEVMNSPEIFIKKVILKEYDMYALWIDNFKMVYILCCLPAYDENNWTCLEIKNNQINIGRDNYNQICYKNNLVASKHAQIFQNNGRWILENYDKKYGTFLNGNLVYDKEVGLSNGDTIFIMGLKIIIMGNFLYINNPQGKCNYDINSLQIKEIKENQKIINNKEDDKYIELYSTKDYFYRSPRISKKLSKEKLKIDAPPAKKADEHMPLFLTLGSTLTMGVISIVSMISTFSRITSGNSSFGDNIVSIFSSMAMIISMLLIPLLTMKWEKARNVKYEEKRQKIYKQYINTKKKEIEQIKNKQRKSLFENYDTTEGCTKIILNKENRLWERIIEDEDFLSINLGIGDVPANIDITYPEKSEFSMEEDDNLIDLLNEFTEDVNILKDAPVIVSLKQEIITAYIDKDEENTDKFIQNFLIQLMAFQSYSDLKLVFLLEKERLKKWEYIKLLPYVWNDARDFRFIEDDMKGMEEVSKYLEDEFYKRINPKQETSKNKDYKNFSPYYLIITDDYRKIENLKIINKILQEKVNIGFGIFCITNDIRKLPNECKSFIYVEGNQGRIFNSEASEESEIKFSFNNSDTFFFERIVKKISNIPIKYKITEKNSLPNNYSFLEMYKVGLIDQLNILDRWKNNDATLSLAAPIGINSFGNLINLDIHEKFHGPHGLIAGSTGSGKSEFIITYILSLAINYHPDDVTFILIDYKGGGLSGAFQKQDVKLPHLVGTITNIDKEGLQRSLVSIQSELKRRQILFNEARELTDGGVIDIYKYQKLYHNGVLKEPIPHLLIICDEFAELKQQQPDFMNELVSVSRIGRSLGVHLILATQKPNGIVDDQIRSNSKFAICLKVQDKSDSTDVIDRPDAAYIKQAGRFYIKVGNDDYFELGQSGWSGAQYYPSDTSQKQKDDSIKFISNVGTIIKEINEYTKKNVNSKGDQLTNIVKEMYDIATKENISAKKLWLDDIPEKIYVKQIKSKYKYKKKNHSIIITIGEYDDPANQRQGIVNLDLVKGGNIIIYGSADSGKETLMSTIVYDLMTTYSSEDVWIYILDFGTETFKIFNECPHVGEVILSKDKEKIVRFFTKIKEIVAKRKVILSEYNGDYNFFLKTSEKSMPLITILINGYDSFIENYNDLFDDTLLTLTREGAKLGITFIISTTSHSDLRYRMTQNFKQKIALSLNDSTDYGSIFEGIGSRKPSHKFGRGLINLGEEVYEFQTAKSCEPEEYNVFIKDEIKRVQKENKTMATKIPVLPDIVKFEEFKIKADISNFPIGLRKKDIEPEKYDFKNNFITIITSKDFNDAMQFGENIWEKIKSIKGIDTIVLDPDKKILCGKEELKNNYKKIFEKQKDKENDYKICFIFGIDKFVNFLEDNRENKDEDKNDDEENNQETKEIENIDDMIIKCEENKNINFIIIDSAPKIKEHNYDEWYRKNVFPNNIIWVGNGIEDQYLLDINAPRKEIINDCGVSFGYLNKKDKTIMIKLLEMKDKRKEDE